MFKQAILGAGALLAMTALASSQIKESKHASCCGSTSHRGCAAKGVTYPKDPRHNLAKQTNGCAVRQEAKTASCCAPNSSEKHR